MSRWSECFMAAAYKKHSDPDVDVPHKSLLPLQSAQKARAHAVNTAQAYHARVTLAFALSNATGFGASAGT